MTYTNPWITTNNTTASNIQTNTLWNVTPAWVTGSEYRSRLIDPRYYDQAFEWDAANPKLTERQQQRKNTMSTIAKIKAERQERKERAEFEALYETYDNEDTVEDCPDGTIIRFNWTPKEKNAKTYTYAGLFTNDYWYLTGEVSPRRITPEELIDWLVEKRIKPDDLTFFGLES